MIEMQVALTGGTGLVGGALLRALRESGHDVVALVRSESSAEQVRAAGAQAAVGDVTDATWLTSQVSGADAFAHTASPGDASSADFDRAVASAVLEAFVGTGKPYVHTGGAWVWGSGSALAEDDGFDAPQLTAWRADVEQLVLGSDAVRGVVVAPGIVYGSGQGLPNVLTTADADGAIRLVGDGSQHWTTVHADQVADLYVRALENDAARGYYLAVNGENPTVREIGDAAAGARGLQVVAESVDDSRDRLGALLADALLLDQQADGAKARRELGWDPAGPSLLDEVSSGSYLPAG